MTDLVPREAGFVILDSVGDVSQGMIANGPLKQQLNHLCEPQYILYFTNLRKFESATVPHSETLSPDPFKHHLLLEGDPVITHKFLLP